MKKLLIIVSAFLIAICSGCGEETKIPDEIRIGGIFPMTGAAATFGKSSKEGMQMAVDEFNSKGGIVISGKKLLVKPVYDDTAGQPEQAANVCRKQIDQNGVVAIVGAVMSNNSNAIAPICRIADDLLVEIENEQPGAAHDGRMPPGRTAPRNHPL